MASRAIFETCSRTSLGIGVAPFFDISLHHSLQLALEEVAEKMREGRKVKATTSDLLAALLYHNEAFDSLVVCMKDLVAVMSIVDAEGLENNPMRAAKEVRMVHESSQVCKLTAK